MIDEQATHVSDFTIVGIEEDKSEQIYKESITFGQQAIRTFRRNKLALIGLGILGIILLMAIFVPIVSPYTYSDQMGVYNAPPSQQFWFGTDNLGRDVFVRSWVGARISLIIASSAALVNLFIGVIYGSISGLAGGAVDNFMMRICDILTAIPNLLVIILLMLVMEQGIIPMILAMCITGWIRMARLVRAEVMRLKSQEYVMASRILGGGNFHLVFKHLIPNAMGTIIVTLTTTIPTAIFNEAFLSYIGLGLKPPMASWGIMAAEGNDAMLSAPWRLFFPALLISITIFAFNAIGDGLRDALDPKMRN